MGVALQRSFIQLVQSRARAVKAGRILEILAMLKVFRGSGRGSGTRGDLVMQLKPTPGKPYDEPVQSG